MPEQPDRAASPTDPVALAPLVARALREGVFDTQHAGALFLRADAERAIRGAVENVSIAVAGRDDARLRAVSFMGARYVPDLALELPGGGRLAVSLTLLRSDAGPVAGALAGGIALSLHYRAVVVFVLDRRLAKHDPFGGPDTDAPAPSLNDAERRFIDQLWQQHHILVEVRRQDPFGW